MSLIPDFSSLALLEEPEAASAAAPNVLARRVIVDQQRAVVGYQLVPSIRRCAGPAMVGGLADAGIAPTPATSVASAITPAPGKPTFVRCTCQELLDGQLDGLDPAKVVFEVLGSVQGEVEAGALDLGALKAARARGFRLAFDMRLLKKEYAAYVPLASYVILEMGVLELDRAAAMARSIRAATQATVVATQVRTAAQYARLAEAGVTLFEGRWYAQPPARPENKVPLSYASLIRLLDMVVRDAEVAEIEELLKHEPGLAYKLLRYINSAGFGAHVEITSFRHAVMTVGLKRLFRWTALLIAGTPAGNVAPAAGTLAIVRGRTMELLAQRKLAPADADLAFVTGMFSMLDTLLGMPLEDALALVQLPAAVTDAVLQGSGVFASYLGTAKACESADEGLIEISAARHRLPAGDIVSAHLQALAWAEQFGQ